MIQFIASFMFIKKRSAKKLRQPCALAMKRIAPCTPIPRQSKLAWVVMYIGILLQRRRSYHKGKHSSKEKQRKTSLTYDKSIVNLIVLLSPLYYPVREATNKKVAF